MAYYIINGGKPLCGEVTVSGAKNAAVAIIPAVILCGKTCRLENIPHIDDVEALLTILESIGAKISYEDDGKTLVIDPEDIHTCRVHHELMGELRASYYLLGSLAGRYGNANILFPGGCKIGSRPVDLHLKGLRALGFHAELNKLSETQDEIIATRKALVTGTTEILLDFASVGATINIMLAACLGNGTTVINNAAKEPHVVDVANFLNMMGAKIKGAGTESIRIVGVNASDMHGCTYAIIPDQIEAGTYMIAAAATRGNVSIKNIIPVHLEATVAKLLECGVNINQTIQNNEYYLCVSGTDRPRGVKIETCPYPGFPTDLQQPMMSYLTTAKSSSFIVDKIWEKRFSQAKPLSDMGAHIAVNESEGSAQIFGVDKLTGGVEITAADLRAGAALVVGALMAEGKTILRGIKYIDRGYEDLVGKLCALGADIVRVDEGKDNDRVTKS